MGVPKSVVKCDKRQAIAGRPSPMSRFYPHNVASCSVLLVLWPMGWTPILSPDGSISMQAQSAKREKRRERKQE